MKTAKIIRHRHRFEHYINDNLTAAENEVHYKIVFSDPDEFDRFCAWIKDNSGEYKFDKETNRQDGKLPELKIFEGKNPCWCDVCSFYLLELVGYAFHSTTSPYNGEIYHK